MDQDDALSDCSHFKLTPDVKKSLDKIAHHASKVKARCSMCHTQKSVWCCLECYQIGCGRYEKKHALAHAQQSNHFICVNMQSPQHLWCYKCDKPIVYFGDNSNNNKHNDDQSSSNSSSNTSQSSSTTPNGHRNRTPINSNSSIRAQLSVHPSKWKNAQSILKSTPIWLDSMNGGTCGMQNLGNTCFMNASLQALLHCPAVIYLFTLPEILYVKKYNKVHMVEEFVRLTLQIWEGKHRSVIPRDLLRCVMYKFPQFRGYGQQDAHEFLTCLLDFLHEQFKYKIRIKKTDNNNNNNNNEKKTNNDDKKDKKKDSYEETSIIHDLFGGETFSTVQCVKCQTKSTKIDRITNISVEIPKQEQVDKAVKERNAAPLPQKGWISSVFNFVGITSQSIPLSLCLHSYCTSEDLLNTEKYYCDKCKSKQEAKKHILISKLPEILTIQIKRFSHDSFWRGSSKVSTHVTFPINELDLKQYIHPDYRSKVYNRDTIYDLCSIVKHMGSTGGGHYISFAKHPATGKWYKFDDTRVDPISPDKLEEQQAYILFYTRRKSNTNIKQSLSKILSVSQQLNTSQPQTNNVLLSRYWLHKIHSFTYPGSIDNLWLSCYHGYPLKYDHKRRQYCSIKIPFNVWQELTKKYGLQYNTKMLMQNDDDNNDNNDNDNDNDNKDVVMSDKTDKMDVDNNTNDDNTDNNTPDKDDDDDDDDDDEKYMKAALSSKHFRHSWELGEKSSECDDCKLEEVNRRRQYEKDEIRRLEDDGCPQDCALSMKWANLWRSYVHNKTNIIPGRIDNRHIHAGNHTLKDELIKDTDYLMIPSNIWTFLIEVYGGGPKIVPTKKNNKIKHNTPQHTPYKFNKNKPKHNAPQPPSSSTPSSNVKNVSSNTNPSSSNSPSSNNNDNYK